MRPLGSEDMSQATQARDVSNGRVHILVGQNCFNLNLPCIVINHHCYQGLAQGHFKAYIMHFQPYDLTYAALEASIIIAVKNPIPADDLRLAAFRLLQSWPMLSYRLNRAVNTTPNKCVGNTQQDVNLFLCSTPPQRKCQRNLSTMDSSP